MTLPKPLRYWLIALTVLLLANIYLTAITSHNVHIANEQLDDLTGLIIARDELRQAQEELTQLKATQNE